MISIHESCTMNIENIALAFDSFNERDFSIIVKSNRLFGIEEVEEILLRKAAESTMQTTEKSQRDLSECAQPVTYKFQ